jgi:hypothetical protein
MIRRFFLKVKEILLTKSRERFLTALSGVLEGCGVSHEPTQSPPRYGLKALKLRFIAGVRPVAGFGSALFPPAGPAHDVLRKGDELAKRR